MVVGEVPSDVDLVFGMRCVAVVGGLRDECGESVGAALGVVCMRNPVYAVMFLVTCFVTSAAIWLMLEAEFLAMTLVLVYVGAVMVLFLFVVMMQDIESATMRARFALPLVRNNQIEPAIIVQIGKSGRDCGFKLQQACLNRDVAKSTIAIIFE